VRIFCAGPLFNRAEQREMAEIAAALEGAGFAPFLPQRDGLVFAELFQELCRGGFTPREAGAVIQQAIFRLDVYQVIEGCDGILVNLNGRVPDEGAVAVAALAWMAGKTILLYKSDARSLLLGSDNPLVAGLGGFARVSTIPEIAYAFAQLFRTNRPPRPLSLPPTVRRAVEAGRRLARALARCASSAEAATAILALRRAAETHSR
jgi:nucleoside 2-deoxyribosyltransferase